MWESEVALSAEIPSENAKLTAEAEAMRYGTGRPRDLEAGYKLALRAARNGYAPAMNVVGSALYYGDGVRKDVRTAIEWYERAAGMGDLEALMVLASEASGNRWVAQGLPMIRTMADEGDARAAYALAVMNQNGTNVPMNKREALRLYKIAADQGSPAAMINYGLMHQLGQGTAVDHVVAKAMYEKAAALGASRGMSLLGTLLTTAGTGVRDAAREREAFSWLNKAYPGDSQAAVNLGWHHYFGLGTPRNPREAKRIWEEARTGDFIGKMKLEIDTILERIRNGQGWRECGSPSQRAFCKD
jgi:TPR repeat protein